jgi:hypothetical protein
MPFHRFRKSSPTCTVEMHSSGDRDQTADRGIVIKRLADRRRLGTRKNYEIKNGTLTESRLGLKAP